MKSKFSFFKQSIRNYKTAGTVVPSSRFLVKRMLKKIDFSKVAVIVELGAGNGVITRSVLEKLPQEALLICFEINPVFYQELKKINHPQLIVLKASAEQMREELQKLGFLTADHIISSLPLSILPKKTVKNILKKSYEVLSLKGTFVQYQYSLGHHKKLKAIFNQSVTIDFEPLNIPMAFVYRCRKT